MKKVLIIFVLPVILLVGAGAGVVFMRLIPGVGPELILGGEPPMADADKEAEKPQEIVAPDSFREQGEEAIFFTMDEFVVNLRSERKKPVFLLVSMVL